MVASSGTCFAESGDLRIAYQVIGDGPVDVVLVPGFVSHQDWIEDSALYLGLCQRLGAFSRVICFDKRGTGASDRDRGFGCPEDRMDDIRAVMDAVGSTRAAMVGISEGGPLTILFAATYPERVTAMVLWETFARIPVAPDYPIGLDVEAATAFHELTRDLWGTGKAVRFWIAHMPEDDETDQLIARYERAVCTPGGVLSILNDNFQIDVRPVLPAISVPALVVHRRGDPIVPVRMGQFLGENIPGARFEELPGDFHVSGAPHGEDEVLDVIEEFLTGEHPTRSRDTDRVLATVLFTDIVGSTERAAALGDSRWRDVLDGFRERVRRNLAQHRGREVNTRGDDFLALFDGPGRAVRCAQAIKTSVRPLGIEVRSGLHTGEVELQGDDVAGIAVHTASRIADLAGPNEILVSRTVVDLTAGSGLEFDPRGEHQLRGVPGTWATFAAQTRA